MSSRRLTNIKYPPLIFNYLVICFNREIYTSANFRLYFPLLAKLFHPFLNRYFKTH